MIMKKGQAAMEFMMTYGWAILVVLAAIGALAAFGVFDMGSMMPDKTTYGAPFINTETGNAQLVNTTHVTIAIPYTNGMTKSIEISRATVGTVGDCNSIVLVNVTDSDGALYNAARKIPTNAMFLVRYSCGTSGVALGDQVKANDLTFFYTTDSSLEYPHKGATSLTVIS